jgi:hypothetical protein
MVFGQCNEQSVGQPKGVDRNSHDTNVAGLV